MSFWLHGRSRNGKRHLYSIGGVFTAALFLLPILFVLLMPVAHLIRAWIRGMH